MRIPMEYEQKSISHSTMQNEQAPQTALQGLNLFCMYYSSTYYLSSSDDADSLDGSDYLATLKVEFS